MRKKKNRVPEVVARLLRLCLPGFQTRVVDLHDVLNVTQVISLRKHNTKKPFTVIYKNKKEKIDKNISALKRQRMTNAITAEEFEKQVMVEQLKKQAIQQKAQDKLGG